MDDSTQDDRLDRTEDVLGYVFRNKGLLRVALSHASEKSETPDTVEPRTEAEVDNERLEFLGDSVLGMLVCEHLFSGYSEYSEGELTRIKSVVVSKRVLARLTKEMGLDAYLAVGKGMASRRELPESVLADLFEAAVAAIYLDSGLERVRRFGGYKPFSDDVSLMVVKRLAAASYPPAEGLVRLSLDSRR